MFSVLSFSDPLTISFSVVSDLNSQILKTDSVNDLLDIRLELANESEYFPALTEKLIRCVDKKLFTLNERQHKRNN